MTVSAAVITATHLVILTSGNALVGENVTVTVEARDSSNALVSTFSGQVTLNVSGTGTGGGALILVNGTATTTISSATAQTITLSLTDISTSLDVSATATVTFNPLVVTQPIGGGGSSGSTGTGTPAPTTPPAPAPEEVKKSRVSLKGFAYPNARVTLFALAHNENVPLTQQVITNATGAFELNSDQELLDVDSYGIYTTDANGLTATVNLYTLDANGNIFVKDILVAPTLEIKRPTITTGDTITVNGYLTPGNAIGFEIDGKAITPTTLKIAQDGEFTMTYITSSLSTGDHTVRAIQSSPSKIRSEFSTRRQFRLTTVLVPVTDMNSDDKVDATDATIFVSFYLNKNTDIRNKIDFNGDGKVDVQDLSIFLRTLSLITSR